MTLATLTEMAATKPRPRIKEVSGFKLIVSSSFEPGTFHLRVSHLALRPFFHSPEALKALIPFSYLLLHGSGSRLTLSETLRVRALLAERASSVSLRAVRL